MYTIILYIPSEKKLAGVLRVLFKLDTAVEELKRFNKYLRENNSSKRAFIQKEYLFKEALEAKYG